MALNVTQQNLIDYIAENYDDRGGTVAVNRIKRAIENGLRWLSHTRVWSFLTATQALTATPLVQGSTNAPADTVTVAHNATTVTGNLTTFPAASVGAFIEFNGETNWYEITVRTSDTALTIRNAYRNVSALNLTAVDYRILFPLIDLPANFRKALRVYDVSRLNFIAKAEADQLWWINGQVSGGGQPRGYATYPKRNDPNLSQLLLYPAPNAIENYELVYARHAGWFSSATPATSTWAMRATATTDYVDWPESKLDILYAATLWRLWREVDPMKGSQFKAELDELLDVEQSDDNESGEAQFLGDDAGGDNYEFARITPPT